MNENLIEAPLYQYSLVLCPHEDLQSQITQVKKEFNERFNITGFVSHRQYLTIIRFQQNKVMQPKIITHLHSVARSYHPLKIELKDYGSLPTHTIHINVTSKVAIQNLIKEIRSKMQKLMRPDADNKPHFIMDPHFIIATRLLAWQYEKAWLEYSNGHFRAGFIASGMKLLRQKIGEKKYEKIAEFNFMDVQEVKTQQELFYDQKK